jgi:hypothetical protein
MLCCPSKVCISLPFAPQSGHLICVLWPARPSGSFGVVIVLTSNTQQAFHEYQYIFETWCFVFQSSLSANRVNDQIVLCAFENTYDTDFDFGPILVPSPKYEKHHISLAVDSRSVPNTFFFFIVY